ncbi:hypothetical protein AK812_SmicGene48583, partial [Symbiodinium microadriaticum]
MVMVSTSSSSAWASLWSGKTHTAYWAPSAF